MLTISKMFTILCLLCLCGNREYPDGFQNKSVRSSFKWMPKYILFLFKLKEERRSFLLLAKLKRRGRPFSEVAKRGATLWDYPQEHLVVIKEEKFCPFVKFEIILPLLCCLIKPLTNKHCRARSSVISLWIDSRTCQKNNRAVSKAKV